MTGKREVSPDYLFAVIGKLYIENELVKAELNTLKQDKPDAPNTNPQIPSYKTP